MTARYDLALKGRRHLPEPYHFIASGLPNVYLRNGIKIERDAEYGELVSIDHLPDLMMAIAFSLVRKPDRLTGEEMRFLLLAHVADDTGIAEDLRLEAETLMRPSQRNRRAPRAGPWLVAA